MLWRKCRHTTSSNAVLSTPGLRVTTTRRQPCADAAHSHATPLHGAAGSGYVRLCALLLSRGARTDIRDKLWDGTPRGWAEHGGQYEVLALLDASAGTAE